MKACYDWLEVQNKKLEAALKANAKAEVIEKIYKNQTLANNVIDLGNWIITGTWKSQFRRDPKLFQETENKFEQVSAKLNELKKSQPDGEETKLIEACAVAGNGYKGDMDRFLENWLKREQVTKQGGVVADQVLNLAKATAILGMEDTSQATTQAAGALTAASTIMMGGLLMALVLGSCIAILLTRSITKPITAAANTLAAGAEQTSSAAGQVSSASQRWRKAPANRRLPSRKPAHPSKKCPA